MSSIIDDQYDKGIDDICDSICFVGDIKTCKKLNIEFHINFNYWNISPNIAINRISKSFEIEWLCVGLYFDIIDYKKYIRYHQPKSDSR